MAVSKQFIINTPNKMEVKWITKKLQMIIMSLEVSDGKLPGRDSDGLTPGDCRPVDTPCGEAGSDGNCSVTGGRDC